MFVSKRENNISYKLLIHRIQDTFKSNTFQLFMIIIMKYFFYFPDVKYGSIRFYFTKKLHRMFTVKILNV